MMNEIQIDDEIDEIDHGLFGTMDYFDEIDHGFKDQDYITSQLITSIKVRDNYFIL